MMTTCRLLCALLVLALCCCPSVCGADAQPGPQAAPVPPPPPPQPPTTTTTITTTTTTTAGQSGLSRSGPETGGIPGNGQAAKNSATEPAAETIEAEAPHLTDLEPIVNNEPNTSLTGGKNGNKGSEIGTGTPADKEVNNAEDSFETTTKTTTTKAPTTTTTTTTTTTQAPSTTTTEAPSTTTTRAPSSLREIDGSLSSSAWVCAPLVLAASALAYTAVG
ncbi:putative mucin TcMUCII [Trypanosoma cruzi]|uniref:Mucin TcMUCII, putative n=2 Tax=Trypanosoma cruzi TaxID=5693 RepID=Q4DC47_TRYCC|nr:mucin TcMUCII, putative [Trypanosoma cruzi]EAN90101.1 mucin TcMUCII, putative [Trypanosoma cruzi]PWV21026.1 putative mucin TcMUCII [Trypanosoma cruzi]|eukprot:XP_811952.1 mucin TcMUCII [Trypanosoma cruzi strain CL Brener]